MKSKRGTFVAVILSAILAIIVVADALYAYDSVVTGKNNAQIDVAAVQEAVDKGGTVLLKGAFDFGPKGRVNINNDVEIVGETDSSGKPLTKVNGGFWSFHSPLPTTELPLPGPGPKVKISHIHFDGATWAPIYFAYTSGAEISENKITNIKPYAVKYKWKGGETLRMHAGGIMGNRYVYRKKMLPGAVTGNLIFNNNYIDLKTDSPQITMGQGAFILWTWGATIEVKGNTIRNVYRNSIECLDNYLDEEGRGSLVIAENNVVTPAVGIPFPSPSTPNGILAGWFFDRTGGSDPTRTSKITILRNFVQTNGDTSFGIAVLADGVAILGNRVEVKGGSNSRGIVLLASKGFVSRNQIDGTGKWALISSPWKKAKADNNTFAWNDFSGFEGSAGDFYCGGNQTVYVGADGKVVDKGKANQMFVMK